MPENIFEVDFLAIANPGILKDNSNEEFNGYDFKKIALKRTLLSFK